jgi:CheY-like chemotaxis protein
MHAVVVDPEPSSRGLVRLSLESAGYRVLEAVDAEGGRRLIEEHLESLRLVVTAVELPGETRRHLLARLAEIHPDISAFGKAARSFPVLEPPFSAERLGAAIEKAKVLTAGRGVNVGGEARVESGSKPRMCPACGSARVMPVAYGVASTGMMKDFAAGRVALGGVRESPGSPHWRCRDCDRTWSDAAQGPRDSR